MQLATFATVRWWSVVAVGGALLLAAKCDVRDTRFARGSRAPETRLDGHACAPDLWATDYEQRIRQLCANAPDRAACTTGAARAVLEPPALVLPRGPMMLDRGELRAAERRHGRVLLDARASEAERLTGGAQRQLGSWLLDDSALLRP